MKVTLITATYNSSAVIQDCLNSVKQQDYPNLEHLIIDGNSTDSTLSLIEDFRIQAPNVRLISEPDSGIYDALNKGIAAAKGEVIGFVHSDDLLADRSIVSKIMECMNNKEIDGVYGDLVYIDKNNSSKAIRSWKSCHFEPKLLSRGWMPAHPTLFLKRHVYAKHGGFNLSYKIASDYDFMLRVLKDNTLQFRYLPEVITKMRIGGASNSSIKNVLLKSREDYQIIKNNDFKIPAFTLFRKNFSKIRQFF